ncbi:MAG TPA: mannose-6-phosphate isomerase, partial [Acidimicrobiia bacterium]|nr:mannose-6-phosphate isomerase [Acidimicrobiia bacterium]
MTTDTLGFLDAVTGLPEQLAAAHEAAGKVHAERFPRGDDIRNIIVMGMGGSGIAGDVAAAAFNDELPVPI